MGYNSQQSRFFAYSIRLTRIGWSIIDGYTVLSLSCNRDGEISYTEFVEEVMLVSLKGQAYDSSLQVSLLGSCICS